MSFNLNDYTEEQQYDLLRRVINEAAESPEYGRPQVDPNDASQLIRESGYHFDDEPGHVNLLGARGFVDGKPETDDVTAYDDTLFVIYKDDDDTKHVEHFVFATDTRYFEDDPSKADAYLVLGQHPYKLGCHKKGNTRIKLDDITVVYREDKTVDEAASRAQSEDTTHWGTRTTRLGPVEEDFDSFGVGYRALIPYGFGTGDRSALAVILRDTSHDRDRSEGEVFQDNTTINIHHACYARGPASRGCQTIPGWENYKRFIRLVEQDYSVKVAGRGEGASTVDPNGVRELVDSPSDGETGTRPVIYTLVRGTFIEEVARRMGTLAFPIDLGEGQDVDATTLAQYFEATEQTFAGGYFPIGANTVWHGGVHLHAPTGSEVHACLDGRIVAARLAPRATDAIGHYGSRNFILVEHQWREQQFFSLYMHLLPQPLDGEALADQGITWPCTDERVLFTVIDGQSVEYRNVAGVNDVKEEDQERLAAQDDEPRVVGTLDEGDEVELIEEEADAGGDIWYKVRLPEYAEAEEGYIYSGRQDKLERSSRGIPDEELLEQLTGGDVVKLDIPVRGGELLWHTGEHGSEGHRAGLLHWEVFSEENLFPSEEEAEAHSNGTAAGAGPLPDNPAYVTGVTGPQSALIGERVTYEARLNKSDPTPAEKANISWKFWCVDPGTTPPSGRRTEEERRAWWNEQEHETRAEHGVTLTIEITPEMGGKQLIARPYRSYIEPGAIEAVTSVSTLEKVKWEAVEDADDNFNMDGASILELFEESQEEGWFDSDEVLEIEELKQFYADEEKAKPLRRYACKFVNEWGIPDIQAAVDELRGRWVTWDLAERIQPYLWWDEARDADVELPDSPHVWHYNPITVLQALWQETGAASTTSAAPAEEGDVQSLQEILWELGFLIVGEPDGDDDRATRWAVREFQIYAGMDYVAREDTSLSEDTPYVERLAQVENTAKYEGPISGEANDETWTALRHWRDNDWRCPVVIQARSGADHADIYEGDGIEGDAENLWYHDDVQSQTPRMFAVDFTDYYDSPDEADANDVERDGVRYVVLGDWTDYSSWSGPRSEPKYDHTWAEGEILPEPLIGSEADRLTAAQQSTFKVVRAVSELECLGFFDSVNAYDNAFISVGPCHWTLGIIYRGSVEEGELCGYLAYLYYADQAAFETAFERFGLQIDEDWVTVNEEESSSNEYVFEATGADLFSTTQRKYTGWVALQQEDGSYRRIDRSEEAGNYFKTWHWFYRFVMAGRTVEGYRRGMWDMARIRLRDILDTPWGHPPQNANWGANTTIGDVFTSEKAVAMILRWHIRGPSEMVANGAARHLQNALNRAIGANPDLNFIDDPGMWTDDHERALVEGLIREVPNSDYASPDEYDLDDHIQDYLNDWPTWFDEAADRPSNDDGVNPHGFTLSDFVDGLSEQRNSLQLDRTNLPPAP